MSKWLIGVLDSDCAKLHAGSDSRPVKIIAHRGGMQRGLQNSPEGVRLAARLQADFVELDIVRGRNGEFHCAHGLGRSSGLKDCLAQMTEGMGLIAHLKGNYKDADLRLLMDAMVQHLSVTRIVLASHRSGVLRQVRQLFPEVRLARFGFVPAITALWSQQPWEYCLVNQIVLSKWHVERLQQRGYVVFASCLWELRSRRSVKELGVDGAFVNLSDQSPRP